MPKNESPRSVGALPEAKNKVPGIDTTTAAHEAQGLRFAIDRLDRSRRYLRGSLHEGLTLLALLRRHPDPEAAAHVSRQEQRVARTKARLVDVQNGLTACHAALARVEGGAA